MPLKVNVTALLPLCRCAETVPADHALQMALRLTTQEAVMGQVIPRQHPAVVLRSQYKAVLAMLCVALVAIVALAATLVIVANDDGPRSPLSRTPSQQQILPPGTRFDGGRTRARAASRLPRPPSSPRAPASTAVRTRARAARSPTGSRPTRARATSPPDEGFKARAGGPRCCRPLDRAAVGDPQHPGARPSTRRSPSGDNGLSFGGPVSRGQPRPSRTRSPAPARPRARGARGRTKSIAFVLARFR